MKNFFYKCKIRKRHVCSEGEIDLGGCYFRSSWSGTDISGIRYFRSKRICIILILAGLKPTCHAFSVWLDLIATAPSQTKQSKTWVWFYNQKIPPPPHNCITTTILDVISLTLLVPGGGWNPPPQTDIANYAYFCIGSVIF